MVFVISVYAVLAMWAMWLDRASGAGFEVAAAFSLWGLLRWLVVAPIIWFIGIHGFGGIGGLRPLYRATAIAHAPLLIQVMPLNVDFANVVAGIWFVAALIAATYAVLGLSALRAVGTGVMAMAGLLIVSNVFLIPIAIFGVM